MAFRSLALACAAVLCFSVAQAEAAGASLSNVTSNPRHVPARSARSHHAGPLGPALNDYREPARSKQDIADEKKLEHDMKICIGC